MELNKAILICMAFLFASCGVKPKPINYNEDQCHACKMIISDSRFGAELVTKKGKIYKYDAIECMVPVIRSNSEDDYAYIMVTDFHKPGKLIDATSATYLQSENLPSPMGGCLSAYKDPVAGVKAEVEFSGEVYKWNELKESVKMQYP